MGDFDFLPDDPPETEVVDAPAPPARVSFGSVEEVRRALAQYDRAITEMVATAGALNVTDEKTNNDAGTLAGKAKKLWKGIENTRKATVAPARDYETSVNGLCKCYQDRFATVETGLKRKITDYQARVELERRKAEAAARQALAEAQARLDAEARAANVEPVKIDVQPVIPAKPAIIRTEHGSVYQRKFWAYDIDDPNLVPTEYLVVNEPAIRKAVQSGIRHIPGVRIYEQTTTSIRT